MSVAVKSAVKPFNYMQKDKWLDTKSMVKEKFTVLEEGLEEIEDVPRGTVDFLEFDGPQGKMRLEFISTPVVLDKKTIYSKTGATASNVQYTYSEDEFVHRLEAYKWNNNTEDWEEISSPLG
jgi:hypothetical protein